MKKIIIALILLVVAGSFAGCKKKPMPDIEERLTLRQTSYEIEAGQSAQLLYEAITKPETTVEIVSLNPAIVRVDGDKLYGLAAGTAVIEIYLSTAVDRKQQITVTVTAEEPNPDPDPDPDPVPPKPDKLEIMNKKAQLLVGSGVELIGYIAPSELAETLVWSSSDEAIATVDAAGQLTPLAAGTVTITLGTTLDSELRDTFELTVFSVESLLDSLHLATVLTREVTTYGENPKERVQDVYGSVFRYLFKPLAINEQIIPITPNKYQGKVATPAMLEEAEQMKLVRSGILHEDLLEIVYHDTANTQVGANAAMHAKYMVGDYNLNNRARSWHYTVDDQEIIHHIPDDEVTWQGDSYEAYAKSIGIETCVNFGSDLYRTWQHMAKLLAHLLVKHNLGMTDIKRHHDMNGKICPRTLMENGLYDYAISLAAGEYLVKTLLADYTLELKSLAPQYLDNTGKVIAGAKRDQRLAFEVKATAPDGEEFTKLYYSILKGSETAVTFSEVAEDLAAAEAFDRKVAALPDVLTQQNSFSVPLLVSDYAGLTPEVQDLVGSRDYLNTKEIEYLTLYAVASTVVINRVVAAGAAGSYNFVEIKNIGAEEASLEDVVLRVANSEGQLEYHFPATAKLAPGAGFIVAFGPSGVGADDSGLFVIPDAVVPGVMPKNDIYVDLQKAGVYLDLVGMDKAVYVDHPAVPFAGYGFATTRRHDIDTDNNARDFRQCEPHPAGTGTASAQAFNFAYRVLALNRTIVLEDEAEITALYDLFATLSAEEQQNNPYKALLDEFKVQLDGLKNPSVLIVHDAIKQVQTQIVADYAFPVISDVTFAYAAGEDESYYNLATGEYLKLSHAYKPLKFTATHGTYTAEFEINFGIAKAGEVLIYNTGAVAPSGTTTAAGGGTAENQQTSVGFGGVAIKVAGKVYFIGKDALINLFKPSAQSNALTQTELRPLGGVGGINNQGIVNGVATPYKGTGALYYNRAAEPLTFDLSDTYGRNNAGAYGYFKVLFGKNSDGVLCVKEIYPNTGTNETTDNYQVTLAPGEYLWCPHSYETNKDGGTHFMYPGAAAAGGVLTEGAVLEIIRYKNLELE